MHACDKERETAVLWCEGERAYSSTTWHVLSSVVKGCDRPRSTQGLPGPSDPEESEKSPESVPRGRAPKVPKESESQKSPERV